MDFVDKQHVAGFEVCQDRRQITRLGQDRAGRHPKVHAQFAGHDLRKCRLAQTGGTMKKRMIHRFAAAAGAFDKDRQVRAGRLLANERIKRLRTQRAVGIFWLRIGAQGGVRLVHRLSLSFRGQQLQGRTDQCRGIRIGRIACRLCHGAGGFSGYVPKIAQRRQCL